MIAKIAFFSSKHLNIMALLTQIIVHTLRLLPLNAKRGVLPMAISLVANINQYC